jgi:hypothetical protein
VHLRLTDEEFLSRTFHEIQLLRRSHKEFLDLQQYQVANLRYLYLTTHLNKEAADYVAPVYADVVFPFGGMPENAGKAADAKAAAQAPDWEKVKAHAAYITSAMGGYVAPTVSKVTPEEALRILKKS